LYPALTTAFPLPEVLDKLTNSLSLSNPATEKLNVQSVLLEIVKDCASSADAEPPPTVIDPKSINSSI